MQVEIINPQGNVSYRRPHNHPDVMEALSTPGYSVRGAEPKGEPQVRISAVLATVEQRFFTTTLAACPPGLFVFDGHYGFKTEYSDENGPEAYCEPSGEYFWGGAKSKEQRAKLVVTPAIIMVANVEVSDHRRE